MGRIRTKDIKKLSFELIEKRSEFGDDFEMNKESVNKLNLVMSKRDRNKVAGYVTRIKKHGK